MRKYLFKKSLITTLSLLLAFIYLGQIAQAAATSQIYIAPASGTYASGQTFTVSIKIKAQSAVNAVVANITYPTDKLSVNSISYNDSAFGIQATSKDNNGTIIIERGTLTPVTGDVLVAAVNFTPKVSKGSASINFANGAVLVNEGKEVPSTKSGAIFTFNGTAQATNSGSSQTPSGSTQNPGSAGSTDINAGNPGATTKITVVGSDNRPIKNATVTIDGQTKTTNDKGEVEFDLSLGTKTATIKYGDKTSQKTFALGMATSKDNPMGINAAIEATAPRSLAFIIIAVIAVLALVIFGIVFLRKLFKRKKASAQAQPEQVPSNMPVVGDVIQPLGNVISAQNEQLITPPNPVQGVEPVDNIQKPPTQY